MCIRDSCSARGRKVAQLFLQLPAAAEAPGYYEQVARPISLAQMKERLAREPDYSFAQLDADMELMVANAHLYNDPATQVCHDLVRVRVRANPDPNPNPNPTLTLARSTMTPARCAPSTARPRPSTRRTRRETRAVRSAAAALLLQRS